MKVMTRREQDYLVDILAIIRVAMLDYENDPIGTTALVNGQITGILIPAIGGKKGVERSAKKMDELLKKFAEKGIDAGIRCDEKV